MVRAAATDRDADGPHGAAAGSGRRRRWLSVATTVAVLAVAVAVAARAVDVGEVLGAIRRADPRLLAAALAVYAVSWPLRGRRYGDVLAPMDRRLGTGFLTLATFASQTANLVVPARAGDAARAYLLRDRRGVPYATGAASLAVERVFDLVAIAALGTAAAGWLVATGVVSLPAWGPSSIGDGAATVASPGTAAAIGAAAVGTLVVGAVTSHHRSGRRLPDSLRSHLPDRLRSGALRFGRDLGALAAHPRAIATACAGSLAIWTLDALTAVLVLAAVADTSPAAVLAAGTLAVCAGNLAKVLPLTQGGIGLYEGAFAATVVAASPVVAAPALAAAVLDHGLKNAVTVAGGALAGVVLATPEVDSDAATAASPRTDSVLGRPKK